MSEMSPLIMRSMVELSAAQHSSYMCVLQLLDFLRGKHC